VSLSNKPTLYLVSTPIGNLSEFCPRAQSVLESVSFILCEDTRHTLKLLSHFQIKNHLESLHLFNEKSKVQSLIEKILSSPTQSAALVSDAGMPAICDPGSYLVAAAHEQNLRVIVVSGPSSLTSALAASGFIQPRTLFSGFLSKQRNERIKEFEIWLQTSPCIAVFFESPKRVIESLQQFLEFLGEKFSSEELNLFNVCISREISKKFEEHKQGKLNDVIEYLKRKDEVNGEFVVTLNIPKIHVNEIKITSEEAAQEALNYSKKNAIPLKQACKKIALKYDFSPKDLYAMACQLT
jgi:16S rRNA (cytidine1402-2'-O)-methyltransferase